MMTAIGTPREVWLWGSKKISAWTMPSLWARRRYALAMAWLAVHIFPQVRESPWLALSAFMAGFVGAVGRQA